MLSERDCLWGRDEIWSERDTGQKDFFYKGCVCRRRCYRRDVIWSYQVCLWCDNQKGSVIVKMLLHLWMVSVYVVVSVYFISFFITMDKFSLPIWKMFNRRDELCWTQFRCTYADVAWHPEWDRYRLRIRGFPDTYNVSASWKIYRDNKELVPVIRDWVPYVKLCRCWRYTKYISVAEVIWCVFNDMSIWLDNYRIFNMNGDMFDNRLVNLERIDKAPNPLLDIG